MNCILCETRVRCRALFPGGEYQILSFYLCWPDQRFVTATQDGVKAGSGKKTKNVSATNAACIRCSNDITDSQKQWKMVTWPSVCFAEDLGLALATKTCPHQGIN